MKILLSYNKFYKFAYLKTNKHVVKLRRQYTIGELRYEKDRMERARMSSYVLD